VGEVARPDFHDIGGSWWDNTTDFYNALTNGGFNGHLGTSNYLFADGHVKALKPTATMTPVNRYGAFGGGCCNSINYTVNDNNPYSNPLASLAAAQTKWQ
jgi:prepilin-type processing-associated H-X9-DG protein